MSLAAWSSLSSQTPLSFKFPSRTIITKSPITDLIDCGDCVVSGDEAGDIARRFEVMSIPTLILFKDGEPVKRIVGAKPKQALLDDIAEFI
mgnify:CR=1 FL=1